MDLGTTSSPWIQDISMLLMMMDTSKHFTLKSYHGYNFKHEKLINLKKEGTIPLLQKSTNMISFVNAPNTL